MQKENSAAVISIGKKTLIAVVRNFRRQLQMVFDADGASMESF
jgi:hypothetical protein